MPLMGIHRDFDEKGKDREEECIEVFEKPPRKQTELELLSVIIHKAKLSKCRLVLKHLLWPSGITWKKIKLQ